MFQLVILLARKNRILASLLLIISNFFLSDQNQNVLRWKLINGDKSLRINYPLNSESVVFDIGGHRGNWSADIYDKYECYIYIFEPVQEYYETIKKRFRHVKKIHVLNYGLAARTTYLNLHLAKDATSAYGQSTTLERIKLVNIKNILYKFKIKAVDLTKLNIEGGEYDLLEYVIEAGITKKFKNIQVQFHQIVKDAEVRVSKIQRALRKTHRLTYQYPFVWENWSLKQ